MCLETENVQNNLLYFKFGFMRVYVQNFKQLGCPIDEAEFDGP